MSGFRSRHAQAPMHWQRATTASPAGELRCKGNQTGVGGRQRRDVAPRERLRQAGARGSWVFKVRASRLGKENKPAAGEAQLWTLLQGWPVRSKVAMSLQQSAMATTKVSVMSPSCSAMAIVPCMGHSDAGTCHAAKPCKGSSMHRKRTNKRDMAGLYGARAERADLQGDGRHRAVSTQANRHCLGIISPAFVSAKTGGSGRSPQKTLGVDVWG